MELTPEQRQHMEAGAELQSAIEAIDASQTRIAELVAEVARANERAEQMQDKAEANMDELIGWRNRAEAAETRIAGLVAESEARLKLLMLVTERAAALWEALAAATPSHEASQETK